MSDEQLVELGTASIYASGFDELLESIRRIEVRRAHHRERAGDDLAGYQEALAELRALYRAQLRVKLELAWELEPGEWVKPLDLALIQAEELLADGLTLRTIPFETREALRAEREADWSVVLYGFADRGGNSGPR